MAADIVAVDAGQIPVQDDHVVAGDREAHEGVGAVEYDIHRHALAAQPGSDRAGQDLEVLDHQHLIGDGRLSRGLGAAAG